MVLQLAAVQPVRRVGDVAGRQAARQKAKAASFQQVLRVEKAKRDAFGGQQRQNQPEQQQQQRALPMDALKVLRTAHVHFVQPEGQDYASTRYRVYWPIHAV